MSTVGNLSPPYALIYKGLSEGRVIPFLGSGASLGGPAPEATADVKRATPDMKPRCLPTASELADRLARLTEFPAGETPDLTKVAQYFHVVVGRDELYRELHSIFADDYQPRPLHRFLASIDAPLLIVTTNYDDLIERAFGAKGRPYDLVIHTTDPDLGDTLLHWPHGQDKPLQVPPNQLVDIDMKSVTVIYKMHGAVDRREASRDQYVITEDDYIEFLARMTSNTILPASFAEPFQTRPFLFLGYGLRDWNLRVVLSCIEKGYKDLRRRRGIKSWAIQYRASPLERRLWQERGVEIYDMNLDEFVAELARHGSPEGGGMSDAATGA
jgi:hypothetical protein